MVEIGVLGNQVQICIAPGTRKGMYLRNSSGMPRHTARQTQAQMALASVAVGMFDKGHTPAEIRSKIAGSCKGRDYGGKAAAEAKRRSKHEAAVAFARGGAPAVAATAGYAGLPGLF